MFLPNLLIIAGTGNKSGKTTLACRLIEQTRQQGITAIKITPHFHESTPGLKLYAEEQGYSIYEETEAGSSKDTSRMLKAGAKRVFFVKVYDAGLESAISRLKDIILSDVPVICESPALRNYIEPGIFVIMTSEINKQKDISHLHGYEHISFQLEKLDEMKTIPIRFEYGRWSVSQT